MKTRKLTLAILAAATLMLGVASAKYAVANGPGLIGPIPICPPHSPECPM